MFIGMEFIMNAYNMFYLKKQSILLRTILTLFSMPPSRTPAINFAIFVVFISAPWLWYRLIITRQRTCTKLKCIFSIRQVIDKNEIFLLISKITTLLYKTNKLINAILDITLWARLDTNFKKQSP